MKKMGRQMRMEKTSTTTAKRGMARREKEKRFMMIPPSSIPSAAAGRFTAPAEEWSHQRGPACPEPLHGQGAAPWTSHRSWVKPQIQLLSKSAQTQGSWKVTSYPKVNPSSHPKMSFPWLLLQDLKSLGNMGSWLPADGYFLSPSVLTYEEVGLGGGGTILLLQEFVEEGGQARNDRGEAALSQHQEDIEGVEQQPEEDLWESCREAVGKMSFSCVMLMPTISTGKRPPPFTCSQ